MFNIWYYLCIYNTIYGGNCIELNIGFYYSKFLTTPPFSQQNIYITKGFYQLIYINWTYDLDCIDTYHLDHIYINIYSLAGTIY